MDVRQRYGVSPEAAWLGTLVAALVALTGAALAFPNRVYDGFIWRYFWGPVHADATEASCAVRLVDEGRTVLDPGAGCDPAAYDNAIVATSGYTVQSTLGYMIVLVFMLLGVYLLLQRFDLEPWPTFFFALFPFMLFGGALRTVEDAFVAARTAGVTPAVEFPWSALLISPIIYWVVFAIALGALVLAKWLERSGRTETYQYPLAGMGSIALAATLAYLFYLAATTTYTTFFPGVLAVVVALATVLSVLAYVGAKRYWPAVTAGTGTMSLAVIWGHAIDGVANVLANDWTWVFDHPRSYGAKHPINQLIMDVTAAVQPPELTAVIGDAWPFLAVKIVVPMAILVLFDDQFFEESPRFGIVLLAAILAVGLGPGTRDMLRVTFGI